MSLPHAGLLKTTILGNFKPFLKEDYARNLTYQFYLTLKIVANSISKLPELVVEINSTFEDGKIPKAFDLSTQSIVDFKSLENNANMKQVMGEFVKQACNEHIKIVKENLQEKHFIEQAIWKYDDEKLNIQISNAMDLFFLNKK